VTDNSLNYRSPFALPPKKQCTNPRDAVRYRALHSTEGCPVHKNFLYENAPIPKIDPNWNAWYREREAYARGDCPGLSNMLYYVTETNPPDAPYRKPKPVRKPKTCLFADQKLSPLEWCVVGIWLTLLAIAIIFLM